MGAFDHKDHACNKFKEEKGSDANSERAKLNKYIFFFTRYQNHQQSIELEDKLMGKAERLMHELSEKVILPLRRLFMLNLNLGHELDRRTIY